MVRFLSFMAVTVTMLLALLLAVSAYLDPAQSTDFSALLPVSKAQAMNLSPVVQRPVQAEPSLAEKLRARPLR